MPIAPDIDTANPDDPYSSLSDVHYNTPTSIFGNFMSMLQNNVVKKLANAADASPNIPMLQHFNFNHETQDFINEYYSRKPATPEQIEEVKKDRPGFSAPPGVSDHVLDLMKNNWDDEKAYGFIANRPASSMAKWGGFIVGGGAASFADPIALVAGGAAGGAIERATTPFVTNILERLATHETMGAGVAHVGTILGQASLHGAAGFSGFQTAEELADETKRSSFNEPTDWLGALQRVGTAAGYGAMFGAAGKGLSIGLHGYERPIWARPEVKEGEIPKPDTKPEIVGIERRGGLLNSESFQDLPEKAKSIIGRYYKPWSEEADQTARVDAMGQALNGQTPDVSLTLRQGAMDEGARFRSILEENNIPLPEMDMRLERANDEANVKLQELASTVDALKKSDRQMGTLSEELTNIKKRLLDKGLPEDFQETNDYQNLNTLAKDLPQAKKLMDRIHLEREHQLQLRDLVSQKVIIDSMRKHVNGTHEALTQEDMKNYANRLGSTGIDPIDFDLPDRLDTTYDAELNQFAESEIAELVDKINLPEFKAEMEDTIRRREAIPTLKKMAKGLVDCILRNEV